MSFRNNIYEDEELYNRTCVLSDSHCTYYGWHDLLQGLWIIKEYCKYRIYNQRNCKTTPPLQICLKSNFLCYNWHLKTDEDFVSRSAKLVWSHLMCWTSSAIPEEHDTLTFQISSHISFSWALLTMHCSVVDLRLFFALLLLVCGHRRVAVDRTRKIVSFAGIR